VKEITMFPAKVSRATAATLSCLCLCVGLSALARGVSAAPSRVPANTGTTKLAFAAQEWLDVGLEVNGVRVDRLKLHRPGTVAGMLVKHDEANRGKVVVTNGTDRKVSPAIAVAVFDEEGHLLAAANTGARTKVADPGETVEMDIHFGGVFRFIENGATIYVSIEY
jgi:hypothetical protein